MTTQPVRVREPRVVMHPLRVRLLEVLRTERLAHRMVRVTLGGEQLEGFINQAPTDHVKLLFPAPGERLPVLPELAPDGAGINWPTEPPLPIVRDYTVRRYDPIAGELQIDMVLHGHGPGATWAASAAPGHLVGVAGPRGSLLVDDDHERYVLAADETGLPAVSAWLEAMPAGTRADVFVEVETAADELPIATLANATITWLHRNGTPPNESRLLERAVRGLGPLGDDVFVFAAGESTSLVGLRRYLRRELGLPRAAVEVDGYWRVGVSGRDHHEPDEDD